MIEMISIVVINRANHEARSRREAHNQASYGNPPATRRRRRSEAISFVFLIFVFVGLINLVIAPCRIRVPVRLVVELIERP